MRAQPIAETTTSARSLFTASHGDADSQLQQPDNRDPLTPRYVGGSRASPVPALVLSPCTWLLLRARHTFVAFDRELMATVELEHMLLTPTPS
jgi:hypothetical protein